MIPLLRMRIWQTRNSLRNALRKPYILIPILLMALGTTNSLGRKLLAGFSVLPLSREQVEGLLQWLPQLRAMVFFFVALFSLAFVDSGLRGGILKFTPSDADYLFPSPLSRRAVLLARIPSVFRQVLILTAGCGFCFNYGIWGPIRSLDPQRIPLSGWWMVLGLAFCFGGFFNLAVGCDLIFGLRRYLVLRRFLQGWLILGLLVVVVSIGQFLTILYHQTEAGTHTIQPEGLILAPLFPFFFSPCQWIASAVSDALSGHAALTSFGLLGGFYLVTLLLVLARDVNYYETAIYGIERSLIARMNARKGLQGFRLDSPSQAASAKQEKRILHYTLPPFGSGAVAMIWAHLSVMAKRPTLNFLFPILGGLVSAGIVKGVALENDDSTHLALGVVAFIAAYYLLMVTMAGGTLAMKKSLENQPVIRPLPLSHVEAVLGEIVPRTLGFSLFYAVFGGALLFLRLPDMGLPVGVVLFCLPVTLFCLFLDQYQCALWYPASQDALQEIAGGILQMGMLALLVSILAPFLLLPIQRGCSPFLTGMIFFLGNLFLAALLLPMTVRAYAAYTPEEGLSDPSTASGPKRPRQRRARRLPDLDESLLLFTAMLWVMIYGPVLIVNEILPAWTRHPPMLPVLAGGEALFFAAPALLFTALGPFAWRETLKWKAPRWRETAAAILIGLGALPWAAVVQSGLTRLWPYPPGFAAQRMALFIGPLQRHPVESVLWVALSAGISEELLFRGPLLTGFLRRLSPFQANGLAALLFAAVHFDLQGMPMRTLLGMAFGELTIASGSIAPAMLMHAIVDGIHFGIQAYLLHHRGLPGYQHLLAVGLFQDPLYRYFPVYLASGTASVIGGTLLFRSTQHRS